MGEVATMNAIVQARYGEPADVLEVGEVPRPEIGDNDVLVRVRVRAAAWTPVCGTW